MMLFHSTRSRRALTRCRMILAVTALVCVALLTPPTAIAQDGAGSAEPFTIDGTHFTHTLFGFELDAPGKNWTVSGGAAAKRSAGAEVEAYFEREDRTATGHLEVQWNATITPQKYMEQLHEVYSQEGQQVGGSESLRLRIGTAVANRYQVQTGNGKVSIWVIAAGFKEWKLGFLFACPDDDFAKFRNEFVSCLNTVKFGKPASGKPVRHTLTLGLTVETPDPLWTLSAGSYWQGGRPSGAEYMITRNPFAAYSLIGAKAGDAPDDLAEYAKQVAAGISQLNQNNDQVQPQGRGKAVKVAGERGLQVQFENRASFPFTTYLVTVFAHGDRTIWVCQWCLPDNFRALQKDMAAIIDSFEAVTDDGD